jgi:hypothetical protein
MAREAWSRPAAHLARELAIAGVDRPRIRVAVVEWLRSEAILVDAALAAWADKVAADALAPVVSRPTRFHPRASTLGGRTPVHPTRQRPSELVGDLEHWLGRTAGIAERRAEVVATRNALQQGLGLWPTLDVPGGATTILAGMGWSAERIAQALGEVEEAAA